LREQPALNGHNKDVQKALLDVLKYWIEKGVKGFRFDAIHFFHYDKKLQNNPPVSAIVTDANQATTFAMQDHIHDLGQPETLLFIEDMRQFVDKITDKSLLLGEVGDVHTASLYVSDKRFHTSYCFEFLYLYDFATASILSEKITKTLDAYQNGLPCWALNNHDAPRFASRMGPKDQVYRPMFAQLMMALVTSLSGYICLYQGEELGLPSAELTFEQLVDPFDIATFPNHAGRDSARTPMPWDDTQPQAGFSTSAKTWLPVDSVQKSLAVNTQQMDDQSVLTAYKMLIALRKAYPWIASGKVTVRAEGDLLILENNHAQGILYGYFNLSQDVQKVLLVPNSKIIYQKGCKDSTSNGLDLSAFGCVISVK
jgi:alpha-glucosidase